MRVYNYNKERPGLKHGDVYLKVVLVGVFLAFILIGGAKLLGFLIKLLIEYWIWAIGIMGCAFLARHFIVKRKRRIK